MSTKHQPYKLYRQESMAKLLPRLHFYPENVPYVIVNIAPEIYSVIKLPKGVAEDMNLVLHWTHDFVQRHGHTCYVVLHEHQSILFGSDGLFGVDVVPPKGGFLIPWNEYIARHQRGDQSVSEEVAKPDISESPKKIPRGLQKCPVCGEYRGRVRDKDLNHNDPDYIPTNHRIDVSCICEGIPCRRCGKNLIRRPCSNNYDPKTNMVWHTPYFGYMIPCEECKMKDKQGKI